MKRFILLLLYWSGVLWLWRFLHRNEIIILKLHGVMDDEETTEWTPLRPQLARKQLDKVIRQLSKYYQFVSLPDAVDMITGRRPVKPYSIALTFDDGYRNNITHAQPILRRYGIKAAFYMTAGHIDRRTPLWFDRLDYTLQQCNEDGMEFKVGADKIIIDVSSRDHLCESFNKIRKSAKYMSDDLEMLKDLENITLLFENKSARKLDDIFENDPWSALLTWEEIEKASREGVCFGSHTADHLRLEFVDKDTVKKQLLQSKEMIEGVTGQHCNHFCYPNGSFNSDIAEMVMECGYLSAVTTREGTNSVGDNPFTLRRISFPTSENEIVNLTQASGLLNSIEQKISATIKMINKRNAG
jgi:peptidoglycan/xylan/chitin deacetylase (PgdA/CDA1 family)